MTPNKWIIRSASPAGPAPALRLFCFPYAGGGASIYRNWSAALSPAVETLAVQLPGREERIAEPLFTDLGDLAAALQKALAPWLTPPFAFFGHSMGAKIAFELAWRLREAGATPPRALIVSGSRPPHRIEPRRRHDLPDDIFIQELGELSGTPAAILENADFMSMFTPILRADFAVDETYYRDETHRLDIPLVAFGGEEDHESGPGEIQAWSRHCGDSFQTRFFPGDHFFLKSEEPQVLRAVAEALARTTGGGS